MLGCIYITTPCLSLLITLAICLLEHDWLPVVVRTAVFPVMGPALEVDVLFGLFSVQQKRGQKSRFVGPAVNLYCQVIHRVRSSPERCCENDLRNGDLDLSVLSIIEMFWWHGGCDMWSLHSLCKCREASSRTCCLVEEIEEMEESGGFVVVVLMDTDAIVSTCCCVASLAWTAWLHRDFVKSF